MSKDNLKECSKRHIVVSNMSLTRQMFMWIFVILFSKITYVLSNQSFQIKAEHLNKKLVGYKMFDVTVLSLHGCVTECMFIGACTSINFMSCTKNCELNSAGSGTVNPSDFVKATGTIFSDISEWQQSMAKGCAHHQCDKLQRCYPLDNGGHKCVTFKTIGTECYSNTDCKETGAVCNQGYCFCDRLFRYDTDSTDCVQVCASMADTFSVTKGMRVSGFNDLGISQGSLPDCITLCINDEKCTSFEYNTGTSRCRKSSLSKQMVEDALPNDIRFDNEAVDFYNRDCS